MSPLPCPAATPELTDSPRPTRLCRCCATWFLQRDPAEHICDRCDGMEISEMIQNV